MTPVAFFELLLALIAGTLVLSLAAGRLHLPPAVALVLGGMALALAPGVPPFSLDPNLILVLFLPPLLLASAYETVWRDFREQLRPILLLSIGAVVFTTAVVAVAARLLMPALPWAAAVALGAVVSPPDAVAAKAVLQRLRLPARLVTIIEGESMVNDASGLVLYKFAVVAALTGGFNAAEAGLGFVWLVIGGVAIGVAAGFASNAVIRRMHDATAITVVTFVVAWVSYIAAEKVEASGVLAVVASGAVIGLKSHETFGAAVRIRAVAVWETAVFLLEAFAFVLIGLSLRGLLQRHGGDGAALAASLPFVGGVVAAVVLSRFAWVFPTATLSRLLTRSADVPPWRALAVLSWAGMRGVVTLAAALALPLGFPGRDAILLACFGVILFTVLVQGTTLAPLVRLLRLSAAEPAVATLLDLNETRHAVHAASLAFLESMLAEDTGAPLHPQLIEGYGRRVRATARLRDADAMREESRRDHFAAALAAVAAGRGELIRLHRGARIHDTVLRVVEDELDFEELHLTRVAGRSVG